MSSPTSSFLSLNINNITFLITKAYIKESLESLWRIECEGYIESLQEHPFALDSFTSIKNKSHITSALNNPASTLNFHPDTLINKQATFSKDEVMTSCNKEKIQSSKDNLTTWHNLTSSQKAQAKQRERILQDYESAKASGIRVADFLTLKNSEDSTLKLTQEQLKNYFQRIQKCH